MAENLRLEASRLRLDNAFKALEKLVEQKIRTKIEDNTKYKDLEEKIAILSKQNLQIQQKLQEVSVAIDKSITKITSLVGKENADS